MPFEGNRGCSTDCFDGKNPCEWGGHRLAFSTLLIWLALPALVQSRKLGSQHGPFNGGSGLVAQSVEQRPFKPLVLGSSPSQPTTFNTARKPAKNSVKSPFPLLELNSNESKRKLSKLVFLATVGNREGGRSERGWLRPLPYPLCPLPLLLNLRMLPAKSSRAPRSNADLICKLTPSTAKECVAENQLYEI